MNPYGPLARIYDAFMAEAPHDQWFRWIQQHMPTLAEQDLVDLGCGTGALTALLAAECRQIFGVDMSEAMLAEAAQHALSTGVRVQWLCQDIRQFHLPGPVHGAVSSCDVVNYLLSPDDVRSFFRSVRQSLLPGGWFCFDVLGPGRVELLANGVWHDLQEQAAVLYETDVNPETGDIRYHVHMFVSDDGEVYRRYEEEHEQRYYSSEHLRTWLVESGFTVQDCVGDFGAQSLEQADRVCFVVRAE